MIISRGRGGQTIFEDCALIAYRACEQGFPFKVCMLMYNDKHREWCEARKRFMEVLLKEILPDLKDGDIIIEIKSIKELKNENNTV